MSTLGPTTETPDADLVAAVVGCAALVNAGMTSASHTVRIAGRNYLLTISPSATDPRQETS